MIETRSLEVAGLTIIQLPKFSITQSPNHRTTQLINTSIAQSPGHSVARSITNSARFYGFTLIELLVVLVIMGLFVGLVSTIVRPDDRALLRVETERLAQLLDLAATESRLTGKSIAWTADALGYRFWRFSEDTDWSEIRDVDSLRPRTFPQGMKIAGLRVENRSSPEHMRLEFTSYGPTLSFVIDLSLGAASYSVEGSPIGEVRILPDERKENGETAPR